MRRITRSQSRLIKNNSDVTATAVEAESDEISNEMSLETVTKSKKVKMAGILPEMENWPSTSTSTFSTSMKPESGAKDASESVPQGTSTQIERPIRVGGGLKTLENFGGPFDTPLLLLPPEIWETVFLNLNDSNDLHAVANAAPEWRALMEKSRQDFLFPHVFPILLETGALQMFRTCLKWRLVRKSWDKAVTGYLKGGSKLFFVRSMDPPLEQLKEGDDIDDLEDLGLEQDPVYETTCEYVMSPSKYTFADTETINKFLEKFQDTHLATRKNPFITGCVTITDSTSLYAVYADPVPIQTSQDFWNSVTTLLQAYGEHIHFLQIKLGYNLTPSIFYAQLRTWLTSTPNLKGLIVKYREDDYKRERFHSRGGGRRVIVYDLPNEPDKSQRALNHRRIRMGRLETEISQNPMPKMAHLVALEVYNLASPILHELASKDNGLKKVKVQLLRQSEASYQGSFDQVRLSWKQLVINLRSRDDLLALKQSLENGASVKVSTLYIRFYDHFLMRYHWQQWRGSADRFYVRDEEAPMQILPDWAEFFRVIELFGQESIQKARIRLPMAERSEDKKKILAECPNLRLNLSKLRSLEIRIPNTSSIDFLLGVKDSLEYLSVVISHTGVMPYKERLKEQIRFNGYFQTMLKSNIWTELEQLKALMVKVPGKGRGQFKIFKYKRPKIADKQTQSK